MDKNIKTLLEDEKYSDAYRAAYKLFLNGDYDSAREVYDEIYEIFCEQYGRNSEQAYVKLRTLANFEYDAGRYKDALNLYNLYLDYVRDNYILIETDYYDISSKKAYLLECLAEMEEAAVIRNEILTTYLTEYGEDNKKTISALGGLGSNNYKAGKYKEALELFLLQYDMAQKCSEYDKNNYYWILQCIGRTYDEMNMSDKSLEYLQKAYEAAKGAFGEKDHYTLSVLNDISGIYMNIGKKKEAFRIKEYLYETALEILGEEHVDTVMARVNLGNAYKENGEYDIAYKLIKRSYDWYLKTHGYGYDNTLFAAENLATVCGMKKAHDEALEIREKVYYESLKNLGELHPKTMRRYVNLSFAYDSVGQLTTACEITENAVRKMLAHHGQEKAILLYAIDICMVWNSNLENYDRAFELYDIYFDISSGSEGENLYDMESLFSLKANILAEIGKYKEALSELKKYREIIKRLYGENESDAYYLDDLRDTAYVLNRCGKSDEALELINYAISMHKKYDIKYPRLYKKLFVLAEVYTVLGRLDEAEAVLREIREDEDPPEYYYEYAQLYKARGNKDKALEMIGKSIQLTADKEPGSHQRLVYSRLEEELKTDKGE